MRKYVKKGGVSTKLRYRVLRENTWSEIEDLDKDEQVIHDKDIQEIAMSKAMELGLHEFKVNIFYISIYEYNI